MPNNDHSQDNQGNGGTNGRFAGGGDKPGGKFGNAAPNENADHIHGTDADDTIDGLGGNDVLLGHQGADTIAGNEGDDNIGGGAGDDILSGDGMLSGGTIVDTNFIGADTFSHSGDQAEDGTDTIVDFDCATFTSGGTDEETGWVVVDVIELDAETFGDSATGTGVFDDSVDNLDGVIEADTLADFLTVDGDGNLVSDLDGSGGSAGVTIVETDCSGGVGVAIEINDQTFVWDGAGWTDDIL